MAGNQDPLVGRVLAERFEILERIGEGGTGVVYRAKQLSVDRIVAIKLLGAHVSTDPSWVKRFHNEARAASRLDHPNTIRLLDFGQTKEGMLFIAMEFLNGKSLRTEIDRLGRLPPNRVLRILSQACASLHEAHQQGIIHRDIKPDNVYLVEMKGGGDFVKVLDFSVAKLDAPDAQVTRAGIVFGTPAYMSPEQGRGVQLDARSDIYALGILAYEMLTGKPPFDAKMPTEVVMMHLREQPAPLVGFPPQLAGLVMKALAKDPKQRQQTCDEMDQECQACFAELFPRNNPGSGQQPIVPMGQAGSVPNLALDRTMAPPPAGPKPLPYQPTMEQKTMMEQEAPKAAPRNTSQPQPAPQPVEQKTMMAGMDAPIFTPPPAAPSYAPINQGSEQKTMMAGMNAPVFTPPSPSPAANYAPINQGSEQKTMMAGMNAPVNPFGAPQPGGPVNTASPAQRTAAPQPAPQTNSLPNLGAGTQILPDSAGVVAFAREQASRARDAAQPVDTEPSGGGAMFWIAWAVIGIGAGLGLHFFGIAHKLGF